MKTAKLKQVLKKKTCMHVSITEIITLSHIQIIIMTFIYMINYIIMDKGSKNLLSTHIHLIHIKLSKW